MLIKQFKDGLEQVSNDQAGTALADEELEGIAGGKLDRLLVEEWKQEVAYARLRLNMPFDELMAALSETDYNLSPADMQELESIARDYYSRTEGYAPKI